MTDQRKDKMLFQQEKGSLELFQEMLPLLKKHYDEVAHYKDIPLKPNYDHYLKLVELGLLKIFTSRDESGLIGYAVFFVNFNLHYSDSRQALQDIIYIDPEKRGFGKDFISWCDMELKKEGVHVVYHHVKAAHNFGPLLEKLGYSLVDLIYSKRLN